VTDQPDTQQSDHPEHNMPKSDYNGVAIEAMANEYRDKPNANLRMRELGSMRSSLVKENK
jgi:hypothetical protein